jgi:ABC-type Na+ transport system ATPase subunit NatA
MSTAGKTTLLKMVSGLEAPTSGVAYINGYDVVDETSNAQRSMGLCPQFDTLIERMTVGENLLYFGQIKGLRNPELTSAVEAFMAAMNIKRYEKKLIMQLRYIHLDTIFASHSYVRCLNQCSFDIPLYVTVVETVERCRWPWLCWARRPPSIWMSHPPVWILWRRA